MLKGCDVKGSGLGIWEEKICQSERIDGNDGIGVVVADNGHVRREKDGLYLFAQNHDAAALADAIGHFNDVFPQIAVELRDFHGIEI